MAGFSVALIGLAACSSATPSTTGASNLSPFCAQAGRLATAAQSSGSTTDFKTIQAAIGRERDVAAGLVTLAPAAYQADANALHDALARATQTVSSPPPTNDAQAAIAMYQRVAGYFTAIESNLTHLGAYLRAACHLNINLGVASTATSTTAPSGG
jgi:hypothetical protein